MRCAFYPSPVRRTRLFGAANLIAGIVLHKKIVLPHTLANKLTGLLLFLFPLFLGWVATEYLALPLCGAASFAAVEEGYAIRKSA